MSFSQQLKSIVVLFTLMSAHNSLACGDLDLYCRGSEAASSVDGAVGSIGNTVSGALGNINPDLGKNVREYFNFIFLGSPGRATDLQRAQEEARIAQWNRDIQEGVLSEKIQGLRMLINDQYEAYRMTSENSRRMNEVFPQVDDLISKIENVANDTEKYQNMVAKIQEENSSQAEILEGATKFAGQLKDKLARMAEKKDLIGINNFYVNVLLQAREHNISVQKYLGLMLAKASFSDQASLTEIMQKTQKLVETVHAIKSLLGAVQKGIDGQQNHHLRKMKNYMDQLESLGAEACGGGLPPCNLR